MIEVIQYQNEVLAYILRDDYHKQGLSFFTPDNYSQQLAYMSHPAGKLIDAHVHNDIAREVKKTQEVLIIKAGKLRVDLYSENKTYFESRILYAGDIILLASGGHGFEVLEDVRMVEIKQGPYAGDKDKTKFEHVKKGAIKIIE
jgi:hypothetical protein